MAVVQRSERRDVAPEMRVRFPSVNPPRPKALPVLKVSHKSRSGKPL